MPKKKTKKRLKKTVIKNKIKQSWAARGISAPENFLFGFCVIGALLFSFLCFDGSRHIPTVFSTTNFPSRKSILQHRIKELVDGYPIEKMAPYISREDKRVASFLVAIAKKESNWGRHTPKLAGRECYNYWGYRGPENPTPSGYSCFDSPRQAVDVVSNRVSELVAQKIDTPKEMIVWKCGTTNCSRRDRGAAKWIWDVGYYYKKIYSPTKLGIKSVAFNF